MFLLLKALSSDGGHGSQLAMALAMLGISHESDLRVDQAGFPAHPPSLIPQAPPVEEPC